MKKRVVITGLGPVTPIGIGAQDYWKSLVAGRSGAKKIMFQGFEMEQYASKVACPIEDFSLSCFVEKSKDSKYLGRTSQFALTGTKLALEDAGFLPEIIESGDAHGNYVTRDLDPLRTGVILGVGVENMDLCEKYHRRLIECRGPKKISPFALPNIHIGSVHANVSKKFGIKGATMTVSTACASGTHAIIEAYKQILFGDEEIFVTGGVDACITPYVFGGFDAMDAMSKRNEEPEKASRPFDRERDGFVMGEGAGILVVEELNHAQDRGARIYCEVVGFGCTSDAYHIAAPAPDGEMQAKAIKDALNTGKVSPEEVDYVNAHGTSTVLNDRIETLAIKKALGQHAYQIPVSSTKSMTGHLMGGAGGIEMIATALMIQKGVIHATINLENEGEGCDLNYVPNHPVQREVRIAVKNSFAFGGQNAAVLLRKYGE